MKKVSEMTLKEKLGQMIFVGFNGYCYNEHIKKLVEDYKVGNIILFKRNIKDINQLFNFTKVLHEEVIKNTGNIPFISIDQEGGMVTRITSGATFPPGAMTIGATKPDYAYEIGKIVGEELISLGININFAPSLDVNNNPKNPVINVRSYSDDPNKVALFGERMIDGLQENIIATAKHFPGKGDTIIDSHYNLPIIKHPKERIEKIELLPFKRMINKVKAIMTAQVIFSAYDEKEPVTLSKAIVTTLLKDELNYKGLIISDCLEMKAISANFGVGKGAFMGIAAGLDMVLVSHTLARQIDALEELEKRVLENEISIELIDEKVSKILKYKECLKGRLEEKFYFKDKFTINLNNIAFAEEVVNHSLTLVKGENINLNKKTLIVGANGFAKTVVEDAFNKCSIIDEINLYFPKIDTIRFDATLNQDKVNVIVEIAKEYEQVLVFTFDVNNYKMQARLVEILEKMTNLFVIALKGPYDLLSFKTINNFICLYEYTPNSVNTVIKYLKKEITPAGNLPVNLNEDIK